MIEVKKLLSNFTLLVAAF